MGFQKVVDRFRAWRRLRRRGALSVMRACYADEPFSQLINVDQVWRDRDLEQDDKAKAALMRAKGLPG